MLAIMFVLVAAASSAMTLLVPRLFNQGHPMTLTQYNAHQHPSLCLWSALKGWLSLPALHLILHDSIGHALAYAILSAVTAVILRTGMTWLSHISISLAQALRRARTRRRKINNYFIHDFKANYFFMCRGLAHAFLHPCTSFLAVLHGLNSACL